MSGEIRDLGACSTFCWTQGCMLPNDALDVGLPSKSQDMDETIAAQVRPTPPSWIWNQPDPNLVNFEESTVLLVTINLDF